MASSFMGLYVQRDGLNLAQKAQDVTGNNITNSKTEGYTRQHLDLVSVKVNSSTLGYKNQIFLAGAGVDGLGVGQTRDKILDTRFRAYSSSSSDLAVKSNVLSNIEDAIDDIEIDTIEKGKEENKTGLANILEGFKAAWQAFSSSGTDQVDLANIARSEAQKVVEVFHDFSSRIEKVSEDLLSDTMAGVKRVNEILRECAGINRSLQAGYINMNNFYDNGYGYQADVTYGPLEIKDKMNMLLDELSTYVDMSSTIEDDGTYTISVSGVEVVNHFEYSKLVCDQQLKTDVQHDPQTGDPIVTYEYEGRNKQYGVDPRDLTFKFTAMKEEARWKSSKVRFEEGNTFAGGGGMTGEDYRTSMYDCLMKGEFDKAYNLERKYTNDYANIPSGYVPVFNDPSSGNAKDQLTDVTDRIKEGSLKGDLDMYNGAGPYANIANGENTYMGVEYYRQTFNELAKSIVKEFNKIYTDNGITDFQMFEFYPDAAGNPVEEAGQIKVAKTFEDNPIRAVHPEYKDASELGNESNFDQISNTWVNRILSIFEAPHKVGRESEACTYEDFVAHYGNTLGSQLETINHQKDAEYILLDGVEEARIDVMGVSTDEEGVNMLTNQKWYNAMARMMTALDQLLDKLINNTGVVGL